MKDTVITIGRQYGSGGREIGEAVAKMLGIPFYDEEIISLAAEKSDLCQEAAASADETSANSLLYTLAMGSSAMLHAPNFNMPIHDKLFLAQSDVIRELAEKGPCVIVGRCADYVLRNRKHVLRIFIHADADVRAAVAAKRNGVTETRAYDLLAKTDRRRANYYSFYTGKKWGATETYDLCIDSGKLGAEKTAKLIAECAKSLDEA